MNLKALPPSERPRERLVRYGAESLSTIELLAILLGSGTLGKTVLTLASDLLSHFGTLRALSQATLQELKQVKGIGVAKAIQLQAVFAAARRLEEKEDGALLDTPDAIYALVRGEMSDQKVEMLLILLCDVRRKLIHREILSKGTLTELLLHPREIFQTAIRHQAHSIVLVHNHPSGDPTPSTSDLEMTRNLVSVSKLVGIELTDHLIIGRRGYVSLRASPEIKGSASFCNSAGFLI